ncbi:hypothetical protein D3C78_1664550 [compost metagenome]
MLRRAGIQRVANLDGGRLVQILGFFARLFDIAMVVFPRLDQAGNVSWSNLRCSGIVVAEVRAGIGGPIGLVVRRGDVGVW